MNTEQTQLTVEDLNSIKSVIETACSRGAFKADEMLAVGSVYNKLTGFLTAIMAMAQAEADAQTTKENPND